jgi:hypothetical protein
MILATKLKNRFSPAHQVALKNIRVNADVRGCSGFISLHNVHVYVNTEVLGGGYMYRTAQHVKDYTGGANRFARDIDGLVRGVNELLQAQVIAQRSGVPTDRLIVSIFGA